MDLCVGVAVVYSLSCGHGTVAEIVCGVENKNVPRAHDRGAKSIRYSAKC